MLTDHENDTSDFAPRKAAAPLEPDRIEPDLGAIGIALDVNVGRLSTITRVEEAAVGPQAKDGRHGQ